MRVARLSLLGMAVPVVVVIGLQCAGNKSATLPVADDTEPSHGLVRFQDGNNLKWGIDSDSGSLLDKEYFVINHNDDWKIPYWVAYFLSDSNLKGDTPRTDDFRPDPELIPGRRAELQDYSGSGYDRGHNAPAACFTRSREAMSATFLLSNMSPQTPKLNRGVWKMAEANVREKLVSSDTCAWVITGNLCLSADGQPLDSASENIGANRVAVPTHCYKAILLMDVSDSTFERAFCVLPNQKEDIAGDVSYYLSRNTTLDSLERLTGYNFFPVADSLDSVRAAGREVTASPEL